MLSASDLWTPENWTLPVKATTYSCAMCDIDGFSQVGLSNHLKVCPRKPKEEEVYPYACPHCPKKYYTKALKEKHVVVKHGK